MTDVNLDFRLRSILLIYTTYGSKYVGCIDEPTFPTDKRLQIELIFPLEMKLHPWFLQPTIFFIVHVKLRLQTIGNHAIYMFREPFERNAKEDSQRMICAICFCNYWFAKFCMKKDRDIYTIMLEDLWTSKNNQIIEDYFMVVVCT